jgi:hypothetical protein
MEWVVIGLIGTSIYLLALYMLLDSKLEEAKVELRSELRVKSTEVFEEVLNFHTKHYNAFHPSKAKTNG